MILTASLARWIATTVRSDSGPSPCRYTWMATEMATAGRQIEPLDAQATHGSYPNALDCDDGVCQRQPRGTREMGCDGQDNDCNPNTVDGPAVS